MKLFMLFVLLIPMISVAEAEVLWDYDLHSLPPGWWAAWLWEFTSSGAKLYTSCGGYSGSSGGDLGSLDTSIVLPEGIDSLVIKVDQSLSLGSYGCLSKAWVYVSFNEGANWMEVYHQQSPFSSSDPLNICLTGITMAGMPFKIKFTGVAYGSNYGGSSIHWYLENFLLTAYGEGLALQQWTWGSIKAATE